MKICQSADLELVCISAHVSPWIAQLNFDKTRFSNMFFGKKNVFFAKQRRLNTPFGRLLIRVRTYVAVDEHRLLRNMEHTEVRRDEQVTTRR